jgi:hypothetical protein
MIKLSYLLLKYKINLISTILKLRVYIKIMQIKSRFVMINNRKIQDSHISILYYY